MDIKCRLCGKVDETTDHLSEGSKMAQKEYKCRHDGVRKKIHWDLSKKFGVHASRKWHNYGPGDVVENDTCKIYWDSTIQTGKIIRVR